MASKRRRKNSYEGQSVAENATRTLFANIRFMQPDNPLRTLTITSASPNEGKSTVVINLARCIAHAGFSVLVVECDMRRRSLASMLGVHAPAGLYSVLTKQTPLKDAIVDTPLPNMKFLDVEPHIPNPADILSSHRFSELASTLKNEFQYVVYDTPPVNTFVDAAILSTLTDGTILAIRIDGPKRTEVKIAYDQLCAANANVIGACATFCEATDSNYYYAYYDKRGNRLDADYVAAVLSEHEKAKAGDGSTQPVDAQGLKLPEVQAEQ